jgi:hypothetical protein
MTGIGGAAGPGDPPERSLELRAALDATVTDLNALSTRCPARMPDAVAQRLDAALAAEMLANDGLGANRPTSDTVRAAHRLAAPRKPLIMLATRRLRVRWIGAGVLAAAVIGVAVSGVSSLMTGGAPRAGDALGAAAVSPPAPLALSSGDLSGALNHALGARDYGPLSQPEALRRCLDANNVPVRDEPLGAREVTLDGQRGVLLVLPTSQIAHFRLLVVGPDCAPDNPAQLTDGVAIRR